MEYRERAMEKRSHLGMAGHYAAMAEFLYRGYNVAVPSVDVGDDVYVVEDRGGAMWRLQVKTADSSLVEQRDEDGNVTSVTCSFGLSRRQLREPKENELFFMFVVRWEHKWRFLLVPRLALSDIRDEFVAADREKRGGRKPLSDTEARGDRLTLRVEWSATEALGWGTSLREFLDRWPETFPENRTGPGAVTGSAPSLDHGTPADPSPPSDPPTDP